MLTQWSWLFGNIPHRVKEGLLNIWTGIKDTLLWLWNLEVEITLPRVLVEFFALKNWESWTPFVATIIILIILSIWG